MPGRRAIFAVALLLPVVFLGALAGAQNSQPRGQATSPPGSSASTQQISGMYTFLKEGEFVQLTVEDNGQVTGFVSRYGDGESDKGAFLDQFFKSGKLENNMLVFATEVVHGVWFDFKGRIDRGAGKNPGDEAYYTLKGSLTENSTDANKKITARARDVEFKSFPQEAVASPSPASPAHRN